MGISPNQIIKITERELSEKENTYLYGGIAIGVTLTIIFEIIIILIIIIILNLF